MSMLFVFRCMVVGVLGLGVGVVHGAPFRGGETYV